MRSHESPAAPAPANESAIVAPALRAAPSVPKVYVTGTPHANCEPLAQAVWQNLAAANPTLHGGVRIGDDETPFEVLAAGDPDARFIVLADSPTRALAQWVGREGAGTPEQAVTRWCDGVRRLLDHAHRWPDRCLIVDAAEAAAAPEALALALSRWNAALAGPAQPSRAAACPAPTIDPLCVVLAQLLLPEDKAPHRLFEELHASCVPLSEEAPPAATDAVAALQSYRALIAQHDAAATDHARLTDALAELRLHEQRLALEAETLAAARQSLQAAESSAAALKIELAESRQESELLLLQLHQVQEELEALYLQRQEEKKQQQQRAAARAELDQQQRATVDSLSQQLRDAQAAAQRAQAAAQQAQGATRQVQESAASQLAGLQAKMSELRNSLQQQQAELDRARADADATRAHLQPLREALARESEARRSAEADVSGLRTDLDASRQEGELLLLQLQQVQEELEQYYLQSKELETTARTTVNAAGSAVQARGIRLLHAAEDPPHRHLHFELQQLQLGTASLPTVEVRLAEHHGRPGLVLFDPGAETRLLSAWRSTGQEGGRDYLLLVPADALGMVLLQQLGSSDWQWVQGLARLLQQHLANSGDSLPAHWRTVAARLCRQLDDLPARFRYDRLGVLSDPQEAGTLHVAFGAAQYGDRALGSVELRWQTAGQRLDWLAPAQADAVPLAQWPVDAAGHLQPAWQVPAGAAFGSGGKRRAWAAMPAADRALLLAVLDALPGVAAHAADTVLPAGMTQGLLAAAAAELHKDARRTLNALRARNMARRLLVPGHRGA